MSGNDSDFFPDSLCNYRTVRFITGHLATLITVFWCYKTEVKRWTLLYTLYTRFFTHYIDVVSIYSSLTVDRYSIASYRVVVIVYYTLYHTTSSLG